MKLSNISIIFIIIVLPIILLLSYYISLQIDTINMQTAYTSKQLQATREAIEAFEINTVQWNEGYSENADSKRRDVMASINTFTTAFANSLGIGGTSKESILSYIPAIACTLYDGYYIYSPAETKEVIKDKDGVAVFLTERMVKAEDSPISGYTYKEENEGKLLYKCMDGQSSDGTYDGEKFTFDSSKAVSKYEHILKPFNTYSARYNNGKTGNNKIDITVNYTLDNYITIYGTVKGEYVVKSGYLILPQNDLELSSEQLTEKIAWRWNESGEYTCKTYPYVYAEDNTKVYFDDNGTTFQVSSTGIRTDFSNTTNIKYKKIRKSTWDVTYQALNSGIIKVKNENGEFIEIEIQQGNLYSDKKGTIDINVQEDIPIKTDYSSRNYYIESTDFTEWVKENLSDIEIGHMQGVEDTSLYGNSTDKIFDFDNHEVNDPESENSIIVNHKRQVIKQTLISNLNQAITSYSRNSEGEYQLPILTETDWDHILRNVSIISFVQNMPIGMKYYNNYTIATSTRNKEFANPDEIYLTREGDKYYHLPYCSQLSNNSLIIGYRNIDYVEKSYNGNKYYKHSDIAKEACYYCLVQRNLYNPHETSSEEWNVHDEAKKIALARERYRNISGINSRDKLESITVTFDPDGGVCSTANKTVINGSKYGSLPTPTRVGRTFVGWYTAASEGRTLVTSETIVTRGVDHTLYAHWKN